MKYKTVKELVDDFYTLAPVYRTKVRLIAMLNDFVGRRKQVKKCQ